MIMARLIASFGGVGYFPKAPGTVGSLAALFPGLAILHFLGWKWLLALIILAFVVGWWSVSQLREAEDAGWIVVDEVVGQWIALLGIVPMMSWLGVLEVAIAFATFRLLDIAKPGIIGFIDSIRRPWAIIGDDVVSGLAALVLFIGYRLYF